MHSPRKAFEEYCELGNEKESSIAQDKPSPRTEIVYNIEPFGAAIRQGDMNLVWRAILPSNVEHERRTRSADG